MDTETVVDLRLALVVFPDNAELENTLGDLDDFECLCVFGIGGQEGLQAVGELVESLEKERTVVS